MAERTLLDLLMAQAERHPDRVAFRYCPDGVAEEARLTYAELDRRARALAARLQRDGATGRRVLIFCHPGLDSIVGFFGCFYAGAVAVPVDEHGPSQRAAAIIPDARADLALASATNQPRLAARLAELVGERPVRWHTLDAPAADGPGPDDWMLPRVDADTTAVIQYTSGTTAAPKGVVLTHRNYLHNLAVIRQAWQPGPGTDPDEPLTGVSWLPHFHDMGFVGGVLAVLHTAGSSVLMSPMSFYRRPLRWLEAMAHHRGTIGAAPDLGYHLCVQRSTPEQRAALDLSHWAVAVSGGDPVNAATLRSFAEAFAPAGFRAAAFRPAYGLAEATLAVTGVRAGPAPTILRLDRAAMGADRAADAAPDDPAAAEVVGCGRPGGDRVLIVDPDTRLRCGADGVGEIWVAGPSVAHGYWRRKPETERGFAARLADTGDGPFLRTGDRGFLRDGELFITGRCRDLITLAGVHHYPADIEATVQGADPALLAGRGAVFAVSARGSAAEHLVVVQEVHRHRAGPAELAGLIDAIRAAIDERHRVQAHIVVLTKSMQIPTTTSGKIQRAACRRLFVDGGIAAAARWDAPTPTPAGLDRKQVKSALAKLVGTAVMRQYWNPPPADPL